MKSDRGMITLMTVFSGIAALMCLLVGLQLLSLESKIGQAIPNGLAGSDLQLTQWQTEVHTGAIMSLGAGVLVFLFGIRHHSTAGKPRRKRAPQAGAGSSTIDLESLSVRVFEIDAEDRSVEITSDDDDDAAPAPAPGDEQAQIVWHPLDDQEDDPQAPRPAGDSADSIVQSIQDAALPGAAGNQSPLPGGHSLQSFLSRILRRRGRS